MDESISRAAEAWLADPAIAAPDKDETRALVAAGNERELTDRFYQNLEFGTGGLRGILGAGTNRMNIYTVGAAAQGLADYIARQGDAAKRGGIAIACDCRRQSDVFAERVASVCAANGITAYLFPAPRPTPHLSFAVRSLGCTSGVVITASHNPPEYNGFKAYWSDGGQVVPPHDKNIIEAVRGVATYGQIRAMPVAEAESNGLVRRLGRDMDEKFLDAIQASCLAPEICRQQGQKLRVVYTSLHGTGGALIPEALRRRGFANVIEVPEQARPDGNFPTVASPNPEEPAALKRAIEIAETERADLVIGTDPDADRMGIAVRGPDGGFTLMTGNQTGALLTHYLCDQLTNLKRFPKNGVVISTIVSSDFMKEIARGYGAEVVETLTGFKWIGECIRRYEEQGKPGAPTRQFIFGAEESYGYMPCTYTRDKDAVTSAAFIAEAAAVAASRGQTLHDVMESLFRRYGYFQEGAKSLTMPGRDGQQRIQSIMQGLRKSPPRTLGGQFVIEVGDILTGERRDAKSGAVLGRYDLPKSDVILMILADGTKVIARPSGTEPKIKFYILARRPGDNLGAARSEATTLISRISADLADQCGAG